MKHINAAEVAQIVGGNCKTCSSSYETVVIGGVASCKLVTVCTDKHGSTTTMKDADMNLCRVPNR
ncbi:DUF4762 domain-containing protein [Hafnia alvei]|uniref:DUF4762 domain-containing protein n=1 Tax=Hafnia alvei TaxID=569 RepID=UPI000DFA8F19|nr:DUF4762 domain-containing protein [Hafnia alvei]STQ72010.1 Uncharacterised protein [Hafnia alvei]